ncbi:hypothetical protein TELCIR_20219, partial [Teladorsagia circumcincta]
GTSNNYRLQLVMYNVFDVPVKSGKLDWSTLELFNRKATGTCALATSSKVMVELDKASLNSSRCNLLYAVKFVLRFCSRVIVGLSSYIGGTDQKCGVLVSILKNEGAALRITYTHQLPWFMLIYYHTLAVTCTDLKYGNEQIDSCQLGLAEFIADKKVLP